MDTKSCIAPVERFYAKSHSKALPLTPSLRPYLTSRRSFTLSFYAFNIAMLLSSCCCETTPTCEPCTHEPFPAVEKIETPPEEPKPEPTQMLQPKEIEEYQPEPPTPEPEMKIEAPLSRQPYNSTIRDLVIPFSEMCLIPEEKESSGNEEANEKIDWGFISPWIFRE